MTEKAKYRVLRLSHIHNNLWPEGSEIEYDGEPGSALEPLNEAAVKAKAAGKGGFITHAEVIQTDGDGDVKNQDDGDLDKLREEYEALFGEKPHFNTGAKTLKEKIDERRKELGV